MKVLVIEDNRKVASFVEKGLREEGYAVDVAHEGVDGAFKASVYDYDLLIVDIMLPGKSGLEVVRDLRSKEANVPVLFLTARDSTDDVVEGLDAGATTTSPSPSPSTSCWPGSGPWSGGAAPSAPSGSSTGTWSWTGWSTSPDGAASG